MRTRNGFQKPFPLGRGSSPLYIYIYIYIYIYNFTLQEKISLYKKYKKSISYNSQSTYLLEIKQNFHKQISIEFTSISLKRNNTVQFFLAICLMDFLIIVLFSVSFSQTLLSFI